MAILKYGIDGPVTGKLGNLVYYYSNGKNVVRRKGANLHPPTEAQLACRQDIAVISHFLKGVLEFVDAGFAVKASEKKGNAFNLAMSYNKKSALTGTYPNIEVDYQSVLVSEGSLHIPFEPSVHLTDDGLRFDWFTYPEMPWPERTDQVMLLAYFPSLQKSAFTLYGPVRLAGTALLEISEPMLDEYMETYISFISADRKSVSDSVYTGSFNK